MIRTQTSICCIAISLLFCISDKYVLLKPGYRGEYRAVCLSLILRKAHVQVRCMPTMYQYFIFIISDMYVTMSAVYSQVNTGQCCQASGIFPETAGMSANFLTGPISEKNPADLFRNSVQKPLE